MKKEYCKPILEIIVVECDRNIALSVSTLNGDNPTNGENFNDIIWE